MSYQVETEQARVALLRRSRDHKLAELDGQIEAKLTAWERREGRKITVNDFLAELRRDPELDKLYADRVMQPEMTDILIKSGFRVSIREDGSLGLHEPEGEELPNQVIQ